MSDMNPKTMFVGGRMVPAHSSARIPVVNPATEQVIGTIVDGDDNDVGRAVETASDTFFNSEWSQLTPKERAHYVNALADALEKRGEEMCQLMTAQNGTPISRCRAANGAALAGMYRYFASLADGLEVEELRNDDRGGYGIVRQEPIGVAAIIVPWNGPQGLIAWKLGPALVAGCTAVIKPAPETSLDAYVLGEAILEAGIPDGVVNFITGGNETGISLVAHPKVNKIAFTGSTAAGRHIAVSAATGLKRVTLELGGKSAAVLLEDVDLDAFLPFVETACSPNTGQVCRALTRILAPSSRYEEVVAAVADAITDIRTGDPMLQDTGFGPLVAERQRDKVEGYIRIGQEEGARLVVGGGRPADLPVGYYVEPTVFGDVDNGMRIAREEIFGPVLVVIPYDDEDDAIRIANDSDYGLGGGVFTRDSLHGTAVARRIRTGAVGINAWSRAMNLPFGGFKQSGIGRENGPESLQAYLESKAMYGGTEAHPLVSWSNA
jgi:betaine-aldehyde dehydrogenase